MCKGLRQEQLVCSDADSQVDMMYRKLPEGGGLKIENVSPESAPPKQRTLGSNLYGNRPRRQGAGGTGGDHPPEPFLHLLTPFLHHGQPINTYTIYMLLL
jgi:hypothetical protein